MAASQSYSHFRRCSSFLRTLVRGYNANFASSHSESLSSFTNPAQIDKELPAAGRGRIFRVFSGRAYSLASRQYAAGRERFSLLNAGDVQGNPVQRIVGLPSLKRKMSTSRVQANGNNKDASSLSRTKGPPASARYVRGSPVSWASLGLLVITGVGLLFYFDREKRLRIEAIKHPPEVKAGPSAGKAAIGGPFKLINQNGVEVTDVDFKGNWTLIYFGFTHCPDICPDELVKMAAAIDIIEKKNGVRVVPVFISVDPERDSVEQLKEYLQEFHPRLIGLTGSVDNVRKAAKEYRVYYMKTEEDGSDYLVDHSIIMYLMDPNMEFVKFYGKNYDAESLANGVVDEIKNYTIPSKTSTTNQAPEISGTQQNYAKA